MLNYQKKFMSYKTNKVILKRLQKSKIMILHYFLLECKFITY